MPWSSFMQIFKGKYSFKYPQKRIKQINFRSNSQYNFSLIEDNQILPSYQRPLSNDLYMKGFLTELRTDLLVFLVILQEKKGMQI